MALKIIGCALIMALPLLPVSAQTSVCEAGEDLEIVTSSQAMRAALDADLRPILADKGVALARTERTIAALRPMDTISLETENFPGIGLAGEIDNLEVTGRFSRTWERGGKREAREAVARAGIAVAETEREIIEHDIAHAIETLYVEAVLLKRRADLACKRVAISRSLKEIVDRRVEAARDPLLAQARSVTDLARAEAEALQYHRLAAERRMTIASMWGRAEDFAIEPGFIERRLKSGQLDIPGVYSPEFEKLQAEDRRLAAETELRRAEAVPATFYRFSGLLLEIRISRRHWRHRRCHHPSGYAESVSCQSCQTPGSTRTRRCPRTCATPAIAASGSQLSARGAKCAGQHTRYRRRFTS